jgi:hypothetical protein
MKWLNPYGSLWSTPTFSGQYFSADSEAVKVHFADGKVEVIDRFPSTTEGVLRQLSELYSLWEWEDAIGDDWDCAQPLVGWSDAYSRDQDKVFAAASYKALEELRRVMTILADDLQVFDRDFKDEVLCNFKADGIGTGMEMINHLGSY